MMPRQTANAGLPSVARPPSRVTAIPASSVIRPIGPLRSSASIRKPATTVTLASATTINSGQTVSNSSDRKPPAAPSKASRMKVRMPPIVTSVSRRFSRSMPISAPIRIAIAKFWMAARSRSMVMA